MKLNLKTLGILTVVAFLFFPLISPIPGILLLVSMVFVYLSQIKSPESGLDIPLIRNLGQIKEDNPKEEEKENDINISDLGDKVIIIEKKTLYKKDMSYEDCRKYNLKNVNCIGDCKSFEAEKTQNHYKEGHKHCMLCKKWLITDDRNCPCCSSELRNKEKIIRDDEPIF